MPVPPRPGRAVSSVGEAPQNAAIFTMAGSCFHRNRTPALGVLHAAHGWGNAALLQLSIAFLVMLFFDPRRTRNARQPAIIEDAASSSIAKDPA